MHRQVAFVAKEGGVLKKLSTRGETEVFRHIAPIANRYGATVYRKVRIADVVDINQLHVDKLGSYALMAHFDFVIADETEQPLFAVEFDGPGHTQSHDADKDQICGRANLALFRVDLRSSRIETAAFNFVEYLVHLWFLGNQFLEMRASGAVAADEPFMMCAFLRPDASSVFDSAFDLTGAARGKLVSYCKKNDLPGGPLWHFLLAEVLMASDVGSYVALASFPLNATKLYGRSAVGVKTPCLGTLAEVYFAQHEIGQFCTALAIEDLAEEIKLYKSGAGHAVRTQHDVMAEIRILEDQGYKALLGCHFGDDELVSVA